jgi:hypothetical protein
MARPLRIEYPGALYHITAREESGVTSTSQKFYEMMVKEKGIKKKVEHICKAPSLSNA